MIFFLYGEDTYRLQKKLQKIIDRYKKIHKSGLNLKFLDVKESDYNDFLDQFKINSMFSEKKLIIIENFFSKKNFQELFLENVDKLIKSENIIVIYEKGKVDKRKKSFKTLEKKAEDQEFEPLKENQILNWAKKEFKNFDVEIEDRALSVLVSFTGNDLWKLSNEIRKLVNFKDKEEIREKDVRLLVRPKIELDIFKTIDAIAKKDKKTTLRLIGEHLEKGDSPLYILNMINFQFRNLLIVKDFVENHKPYNVILKKSGLHPFVVKKSYEQCRQFSFGELKKIYQEIFKTDFEVKTGRIDPQIGIELFVAKI